MDVTTGLFRGEACRDANLEGTVDVTTGPFRGEACCDAVMDCRKACRDAVLDCRKACRDAALGGTVDVTTGPVLRVFDIVDVTTDSFVAILCCDATMLVLGGDIVGETTDSRIMSLNSP